MIYKLELRQLRYFKAVAEELSFTRAAERLHIAQPPLSQQIRQLEDELGVTLIERGGRPLRLTEAGSLLFERAGTILSDVDNAAEDVRRIGRGGIGKLSVGFAGSAMYNVLPAIINAYRDRFPDVELALHELLAADVAIALRERRIDVGFSRPGLEQEEGVEQHLLFEEPLVAAVSDRHEFASRNTISPADLHAQPTILYPRHPKPSLTDLIVETLETEGISLRIVQEARHLQTALGLVAAGVGITFVPVTVSLQTRQGIRFLPIEPKILTSPMTVVWRSDTTSASLENFLKTVREFVPNTSMAQAE